VVPADRKECERQFLTLAVDVAEMRTHWEPRASHGEAIVRRRRRDGKEPEMGRGARDSAWRSS
jgi:hypothetical protein